MPELPEVESVRRIMERVLVGHVIADAEVLPDPIMMFGVEPEVIRNAILGRKVTAVGRKGKYWWLEFEDKPWLVGHLGMSGWIRELGKATIRLREHGQAPLDDDAGRPRFLKLLITTDDGARISFTDGRRLGRLWLSDDLNADPKMEKLGPDALNELPTTLALQKTLAKRNAPIKALLLDQKLFAGVGNWIADEVLYRAKISPKRLGSELKPGQIKALREALVHVIELAVDLGADKEKFPEDWLFHHRWGGASGTEFIGGKRIVRESVGGRTTAWVPQLQK